MNKKKVRFIGLLVLMSVCAFAQKNEINNAAVNELAEVVVSDSKFALPREKSGKVIVKITSEDLYKKPGQSLANILSTIAGLEVNGNQSGSGKNLGYYIRGARNRQTLIVIDGVPVSDASGINLEYDLRLIPVEQVESIEIMKGAASTLYGSGAAAGVINITLKKSANKAISGNVYMNIGTQTTADRKNYSVNDYNQGFSVNGKSDILNYYAAVNSTETNGFSEAQVVKDSNFEADRFSRVNSIVKIGITPNDNFGIDFFGNYDKLFNAFDGTFDNYSNTDIAENTSVSEQFRFGFSPKFKYDKGEFILNSSFNSIERNYNTFNSYINSVEESSYQSRSVNVDAFNKWEFNERLFAIVGGQFQYHDMNSVTPYDDIQNRLAKFNSVDPYFTAVYNSVFGFNLNVGGRYNIHSVYDRHFVFNINPSYSFSEIPLKFITSYSTAFITPSLYQLYSPYGNLNLKPEENSTVEAGFEFITLNKKINLNTVAFYREENNSIGFYTNPDTWVSNYVNIEGTFNAKGVETMVDYKLSNKIKISGNYTFTEVEKPLSRFVSRHKVNAVLDVQASARTFFNMSYQFIDKRDDAFFDGGSYETVPVVLDAYQLCNVSARYELIKNRMNIFMAVSNLFNQDFVENIGYSTKGRNFKLGLNIKL